MLVKEPKQVKRTCNTKKKIRYDINEIKWFKRQKTKDYLNEGLTYLLVEKEKSKSFLSRLLFESNFNNSYQSKSKTKYNFSEKNKFNPELYFNQTELDKIYKIRDLFYEFDKDKSRTLDKDELYKMFNTNNIPITRDQINHIFKSRKILTFLDVVNFILDDLEKENFRNVMRMIKQNYKKEKKENKFVPTDFNQVLEHFNEQGKIRDNFRVINRGIKKLYKIEKQNTLKQSLEVSKSKVLNRFGIMQSVNYKLVENGYINILESSMKKIQPFTKKEKKKNFSKNIFLINFLSKHGSSTMTQSSDGSSHTLTTLPTLSYSEGINKKKRIVNQKSNYTCLRNPKCHTSRNKSINPLYSYKLTSNSSSIIL